MKGNVTTGFRWQLKPLLGNCLEMVSNEYESDPQPENGVRLMGRGGTRTFKFKRVGTASCKETIAFAKKRGQIAAGDWAGMKGLQTIDVLLQ